MQGALHEDYDSIPLSHACDALNISRSTLYAHKKRLQEGNRETKRSRRDVHQPLALSAAERQHVLDVLNSPEYCDQPPYEVYHRLLQEGRYLCSTSTMYRLLSAAKSRGERRPQRPTQHNAIPRLKADRPNEVWTWDITKLPLHQRGVYLSLYVVMVLYSRYVLAWMVSRKENSALAQQLLDQALGRYHIAYGSLTLHQDRGSPMIAKCFLDLLAEQGVTASHSRPRVSNDNPFSEFQFKTAKYQPDYPGRFDNVGHAREWCVEYFDWYNFQHHHSGLQGFTPEQVFTGRYEALFRVRQQALDAQYQVHPERFVRARPKAKLPPAIVTINPIKDGTSTVPENQHEVNFPTLTAAQHTRRKSMLSMP